MCVAIENIAPDAAKRCLQRLFSVSSSINFIKSRRSRSSGSSEVAESFLLNHCSTVLMGHALFSKGSTACFVNTLSLWSASVARFAYRVSASSLIA